jgi:hypothetical protein
VRAVRTGRGIRSWKSAQGFRHADGRKLRVVPAGARIFHYGWVRPPRRMTRKTHALTEVHRGAAGARATVPDLDANYDFGRLHGRVRFTGTHPRIMHERIAACDWQVLPTGTLQKHDRPGVRLLSWLENRVLGFRIGEPQRAAAAIAP